MKNFKQEKGITLIALIITIVVLLILAGVAIGTLEQSNIIGRAKEAAGSYNQGKADEESTLTKAEDTMEEIINGLNNKPTIGTKVYLVGNNYYILTPENKFVCFNVNSPVEDGRLSLSEGTGNLNIIHENFTEEEINNLKYLYKDDVIFAVTSDRNTMYFPKNEENDTITFSKDPEFTCTHNEELVAKYTYDFEKYGVYYGKSEGQISMTSFVYIDYEANTISSYCNIANGGWAINGKVDSISSIEKNSEEINLVLNDQQYTIGTDAVKITCDAGIAYIQDGTLYGFSIKEGDTIKKGENAFDAVEFFNVLALPK